MSDLLAVFSIIAISLAAITIVIHLLPLLILAALMLLPVWSSFLRNRPQRSLVHQFDPFPLLVGRILRLFILPRPFLAYALVKSPRKIV
jgi:hypothetical protein